MLAGWYEVCNDRKRSKEVERGRPRDHADLLLVAHRLVQRLKPHVAQGDQRVGVVLGGGSLQHAFKLLLAGAPFLFREMQIANQRPSVRMVLVDLKGLLVPVGGFVDEATVTRHVAESQVT